ncbi:histidinol-phosphatase [Martelella soudanensis]|uniref:histidinol-phosphatase n=1 Tax=unclassified Martelella TaxID=2629616 RepID=UPI0015E0573E|nr:MULTISPECIES: histidinol-phosphatase [unclassified Martelella]
MVWFSYHGGHSGEFCDHASSSLQQVVQAAIDEGFTHYGLSEHCPRYREQDLYPGEERLGIEGLIRAFEGYVIRAFALREEYARHIELLVGFETEKLPPENWLEAMLSLKSAHPFDYVVGSVHDINGRWVDYSPQETSRLAEDLGGTEALQLAYFRSVTDMVEQLRPDIVAHLDLVRKFEPPGFSFSDRVAKEIERLLDAIQAYGGVIDVNCAAFRNGYGPVYPLPQILSRARQMGIPATFGDDSHGVDTVGVGLEQSRQAICAAGYSQISYLTRDHGWQSADIAEVRPRRSV